MAGHGVVFFAFFDSCCCCFSFCFNVSFWGIVAREVSRLNWFDEIFGDWRFPKAKALVVFLVILPESKEHKTFTNTHQQSAITQYLVSTYCTVKEITNNNDRCMIDSIQHTTNLHLVINYQVLINACKTLNTHSILFSLSFQRLTHKKCIRLNWKMSPVASEEVSALSFIPARFSAFQQSFNSSTVRLTFRLQVALFSVLFELCFDISSSFLR